MIQFLEWGENYHGITGSTHSIDHTGPDENDVIRRLHEVVKEITGKPVEKPPARKIGFY